MHVEAFVPTMDQFENPGLIEIRQLREEPASHGPFEFVVRVKLLTVEELLQESKQMDIGGRQDSYGVILIEYLEYAHTVTANSYCVTLTRLREAIRRKRPGILSDGFILLHDNTRPILLEKLKNFCKVGNLKSFPHTDQFWNAGTISF
ncbi:hypothetical protein AVEN_226106-1 [Araneus ventricosus]|uniref:Uncharacterized protein n=1 Tax=Araneus ventricosus TaxID=182803 RepID=A0A4Y2I4G0_ARAVE|nr:hypothetical protein AVEN_226106-1 [Araneus ventricosus]